MTHLVKDVPAQAQNALYGGQVILCFDRTKHRYCRTQSRTLISSAFLGAKVLFERLAQLRNGEQR